MIALRTAAACVGVTLALCVAATQAHAKPPAHMISTGVIAINGHALAGPSGVCNFSHRMDIAIIDGVWYECMCLALASGWDCDWVRLPEPAVAQIRRVAKRHHLVLRAYLPRRAVFA